MILDISKVPLVTPEKYEMRSNEDMCSIRVHLSPGSSCGLVAYTLRICTCAMAFMGHTAIF